MGIMLAGEGTENTSRTTDQFTCYVQTMGNERRIYTDYLGPHGRGTRNDNGERLLEICASQHLGISNTFFQHQDSHVYTRYK